MGRRIAFSRRALGAFVLLAGLTGLLDCAVQERADGRSAGASMAAASAATNDREAPPLFDTSLPLMQGMVDRYTQDRALLERKYALTISPARAKRFAAFFRAWLGRLDAVSFDNLDQHGKVDFLLFRNHLDHELDRLEREQHRFAEAMEFAPFAGVIIALDDDRRMLEPVDAPAAASQLADLARDIHDAQTALETSLRANEDEPSPSIKRTIANRGAGMVDGLRRTLREWHSFHEGYDPLFTWWTAAPYEEADRALEEFSEFVRAKIVGSGGGDDDPIVGDPIGVEALESELAFELIPYSPRELIEIAEKEYEWCLGEILRASGDLGFGDDWHQALEHVKNLHVEPGQQPALIRDLAWEAVRFIEERDLVTVPELCKEGWRMEMMSPQRQKVSPYFLGGESILVAFPTHEMAHADKLMSLRGNNRHFARATVQHELIPGHHLQGFMTARYRPYRQIFSTPFWGEGWALYWEMQLWDLGFPQSPEDRIGMLFWRMHRCARIIFSLRFHLEEMTAEEAIEFLIENVGHERNNATAEVRRSVSGAYGPLYQAAYMLGGLQIRALHRDLVESGAMTDRDFHDAILRLNSIPIAMVRATLTNQPLTRDHRVEWRFYEEGASTVADD